MSMATKCTCGHSLTGVCSSSVKECRQLKESTQLPVEVMNEIEEKAKASIRIKGWGESVQFESYIRGATAYASKLHQLDEHFKVMSISCDAQLEKIQQLQQENDKLKQQATGPRWVKCSDRMPEISKPPKLLTVKRYEAIPEVYSTRAVTAAQLADIVKFDLANFEWLDEQPAAGREEDAVAFAEWILKNDLEATFNDKGKSWVDFRLPRGKNKFTTAELYELFKQQKV